MGIIAWIVFGLLAGIVAKLIMPGRDPGGLIVSLILGVLGATSRCNRRSTSSARGP